MFVVIVILVCTVVLLYPYISMLALRQSMLKQLRQSAKENGFRVRSMHRFPLLAGNRSSRFDLLVEDGTRFFAVKLWSASHRGRALILTQKGQVREEKKMVPVLKIKKNRAPLVIGGAARSVPRTKLPKKLEKNSKLNRVLLVYPSYSEIRAEKGERTIRLFSGDRVFDKLLYTPSSFSRLLVNCGAEERENELKTENV